MSSHYNVTLTLTIALFSNSTQNQEFGIFYFFFLKSRLNCDTQTNSSFFLTIMFEVNRKLNDPFPLSDLDFSGLQKRTRNSFNF